MRARDLIGALENVPENTIVCLHGSQENTCRDVAEVQYDSENGIAYVAPNWLERTPRMTVWAGGLRKGFKTKSERLADALKLVTHEMCKYCRAEAEKNPQLAGKPCLDGCEPLRRARAALAEDGK